MKKSILTIAIIAAAALCVSCQQDTPEKGAGNGRKSNNDISFILGSKATKAESEAEAMPVKAVKSVMPIGFINETTELVLEESLVSLDDIQYEPQTKGTPVYTENVTTMKSFNAIAYKSDFSEGVALADASFGYDSDKGAWRHSYDSDPWVSGDKLWFFMRMGDMTGVTDLDYALTETDTPAGQISFSYTSPATASAQKDILFASRPITKEQEDNGQSNVLFYHALTAVKFRTGVTAADTKITSVEIKGLANQGDCVMVPYYGEWSGSPKSNPYGNSATSSKSADCVDWPTAKLSGSASSSFTQSFTGVVDFEKATGKGAENPFADSFYAAAADNNLNDSDASLTFWFIPQQLNKDVKLIISYEVHGTACEPVTLDFGDLAKGNNTDYPFWKAGELRTYTLSAIDVNVTVTDEVDANVKENVNIQNTGNVPIYVRAAIVGYWADVNGALVNEAWNPDVHGTFVWKDTAGQQINDDYQVIVKGQSTALEQASYFRNNWILASDGYYYYKYQVPVGAETIGKLFTSYTVNTYDTIKTAEPTVNPDVKNAHLEMRIIVQAIQASKLIDSNGNLKSQADAYGWYTGNFSTEPDKQ